MVVQFILWIKLSKCSRPEFQYQSNQLLITRELKCAYESSHRRVRICTLKLVRNG